MVVSHAGSGTFLAALGHGLPQLCLPQAADQFENAAACERSGTGLVLGPGAVTAGSVRGAVEQLLLDARFGAAARRAREEIQQMPAPTRWPISWPRERRLRPGAPGNVGTVPDAGDEGWANRG